MAKNNQGIADQCIVMVKEQLTAVPVFPPPPAIAVRWYTPGTEHTWLAIQTIADVYNTFTQELFFTQFAEHLPELAERQCYLFDQDNSPVGTATAWKQTTGEFKGYGQVHWVAVVPAYQGKGLGKVLMSLVCTRLNELGHSRAFLETSTLRPGAVHLYRQFGFEVVKIKPW